MNDDAKLWERIEHQRKLLGLTQKEVSYQIDTSIKTYTNWITRKVIPAGDKCLAIAKVLGTSVEYLLTGEETAMPDDGDNKESGSVSHPISLVANPRLSQIISKLPDATERQLVSVEVALGIDDERKKMNA